MVAGTVLPSTGIAVTADGAVSAQTRTGAAATLNGPVLLVLVRLGPTPSSRGGRDSRGPEGESAAF